MRRTVLIVLCLVLLAALAIPAAADEDYTVTELDPFTGLPLPDAAAADGTYGGNTDALYVNEYCFYDRIQRAFAYDLGKVSSAYVYASVAYGMVTTEAVSIDVPTGVTATLYRNGKSVETPDFRHISEPGSYVLSVSGGTAQPVQPLSFTIVTLTTGALDSYRLPAGFTITSVELDAQAQPFSANEADLLTEGQYNISYVCDATGLGYNLTIQVDHTPPVLELAAVKNGRASGPVDISDVEPECEITVVRDGKVISYNERLTQSGIYDIYLTDAAGNSNAYHFTILFYFNVTSVLFIVMVVGLLLLLFGYLIFTRRHLRVR